MGVHGLWKLLEPSGKPVTLESLENKVLAIDVSMWLHQVMKGYQDSTGNALPNAHLLGLFHRICKLMFYRIKPVFVFDGGVPQLKQQTLASRRQQRSHAAKKAERDRVRLLRNLMEQGAVRQVLAGNKRPALSSVAGNKPSEFADFILDPIPALEGEGTSSEENEEPDEDCKAAINWDTFDPESEMFKKLPVQERIEILTDLKEARKQSSWGRIHEMPQESGDFSGYQLRRLLVRRSAQVGLEEAEKELGERHTLTMSQLQTLMEERGSLGDADLGDEVGHRIASDTTTRFLLVKNSKTSQSSSLVTSSQSIEESTKPGPPNEESKEKSGPSSEIPTIRVESVDPSLDKLILDFEQDESDDLEIINIRTQVENETEMSQAEILEVIKTSKHPQAFERNKSSSSIKRPSTLDTNVPSSSAFDPNMPSTSSSSYNFDPNMPSTSSAGYTYNPDMPSTSSASYFPPQDLESSSSVEVIKDSVNRTTVPMFSTKNPPSTDVSDSPKNREEEMSKIIKDFLIANSTENVEKNIKNKGKEKLILPKDLIDCMASIQVPKKFTKISEIEIKSKENGKKTQEIESQSEETKLQDSEVSSPTAKSESSSDEFEEVPSPTEDSKSQSLVEVTAKPLEIVIDRNTSLSVQDEDIFADIFEEESKPADEHVAEMSDSEVSVESEKDIAIVESKVDEVKVNEPKSVEREVEGSSPAVIPRPTPQYTSEQLQSMEESLSREQRDLAGEVGRQERLAVSISDQMCLEAQELLRLFGLPYVVAPMEAEAQCAVLDMLSLTQGTVTDDSDIWLFGGKTVYRNFFNQNRNVEVYTSDTIHKCFKLTRGQLVLLALLVGSDYTTGLAGVGPVTALEILAAFCPTQPQLEATSEQPDDLVVPLQKFREWWVQRTQAHNARLTRLKNKLKDLSIHEGFPNCAVAEAYIHPEVDDSREKFTWGKPDLPALIHFARAKFGWSKQHAESILQPVVKRLNDTSVQQRLDSFFSVIPQVSNAEEKMSSRVRDAVNQLGSTNVSSPDESSEVQNSISKKTAPSKRSPTKKAKTIEGQTGNVSKLQVWKKALNKKVPKTKTSVQLPTNEAIPEPTSKKKPAIPVEEKIPQRELDRENALKTKMKAIELFRKRKLDSTPRRKKTKQVIKNDHYLSESSSSD